MKRREFIGVVATAAAGWSLAAEAQQRPKWRVGFLTPSGLTTVNAQRMAIFRAALENAVRDVADVEIVPGFADNDLDRLPFLSQQMVDQGVRAIMASSPVGILAALKATSSIPIVAMDLESDPVAEGWATSLAHPGGNVTGVFLDLPGFSSKTLQLLREAVPELSKLGVFWFPQSGHRQLDAARNVATQLGLIPEVYEVSRPADFEKAFQAAAKSQVSGVIALSAPLFAGNGQALADQALVHRIPTISVFPDFAQKGGLLAYGPELLDLYPQAAAMTGKLLKGSPVADLPIERPTRLKLVVNLKTASALGVTIPTSILLSANEVIE